MKKTFDHLSQEKKNRVIGAAITEFGLHGYEKGSTDRIIKLAGISKGGLYEYISSKEELYLFILDYVYTQLYSRIEEGARERGPLPSDLMERMHLAAEMAISYYVENPEAVGLIVKAAQIYDGPLVDRVGVIFTSHFVHFFGDVDSRSYACDKERLFDLTSWILLKTRLDFLRDFHKGDGEEDIRVSYLQNWDFYLSVLRQGIYHEGSVE